MGTGRGIQLARLKGSTMSGEAKARCAAPRPDVTQAKLSKYLDLHADGMPSSEAARKAGLTLTTVSRHKAANPEFKARHKEAAERFADHLEAMAERGAMSPMRYGPTLLIFMLKARRPEIYRENHMVRVPGLTGFVGAFGKAMETVVADGR